MASDITTAAVDKAHERLVDAKAKAKKRGATPADKAAYQREAQKTADLRTAWRQQEIDAGRRAAGVTVSGDAEVSG